MWCLSKGTFCYNNFCFSHPPNYSQGPVISTSEMYLELFSSFLFLFYFLNSSRFSLNWSNAIFTAFSIFSFLSIFNLILFLDLSPTLWSQKPLWLSSLNISWHTNPLEQNLQWLLHCRKKQDIYTYSCTCIQLHFKAR